MKTLKQLYREAFSPKDFDAAVKGARPAIPGQAAGYVGALEKLVKAMGQNSQGITPQMIRQMVQKSGGGLPPEAPASSAGPGIPDVDLSPSPKTPWASPSQLKALGGVEPSYGKFSPPTPDLPPIAPAPDEPFQGTFMPGPPEEPEAGMEPTSPAIPKAPPVSPSQLKALGGIPPERPKADPLQLPGLPQLAPQPDEPAFQGSLPDPNLDAPSAVPPTLRRALIPQDQLPQGSTYAPGLAAGSTTQGGSSTWNPGALGAMKNLLQKPRQPQANPQAALDPMGHNLQRSHREHVRLPTLKEIFFGK